MKRIQAVCRQYFFVNTRKTKNTNVSGTRRYV